MQTQTIEVNTPKEPKPEEDVVQMVGFMVGREFFGVNILNVQEIIRNAVIMSIPDSPSFIEGVINLRGNIIPIIDLRKCMKVYCGEDKGKGKWIIILIIQNRVAGFVVDKVTRVMRIPFSHFSQPPDTMVGGLKSHYIEAVCEMEYGNMILLDFNRILMVDEMMKIKETKRR